MTETVVQVVDPPLSTVQVVDDGAASTVLVGTTVSQDPTSVREQPGGLAGLDANGLLFEARMPARLAQAGLDARYTVRYTRIDVAADHGADRTGATSAAAAADAALTAANAAGGQVEVVFPPGVYDLTAGLTVTILASHVHVVGAGPGVTILKGGAGTLFRFGDGATSVVGGGVRNLSVSYAAPAAGSRVVHITGASSQKFSDLFLDNVRQLALLGAAAQLAGAPSFRHVYGNTDPAAGSVVIDAVAGTALSLEDVILNAKGVGFPTDTTTPHPANDTTFLRFGQGSWDTAHCYGVITNRYNRGLDIDIGSAVSVSNLWFTACVWDYCKTSGIRLRTNHAGANLRSVYLADGWAVATDGHSVEVAATLGVMKNVRFTGVVARQAGQNNWRLGGFVSERVELNGCHSLGANRLAATNTGTLQDDTTILGNGFTIRGGSFGEDGASYTGFACRGRYGVSVAPDVDARVVDVEADGTTGAFLVNANSVSSRKRLITRNRAFTDALPEYATTSAPAAPTSNVLQTHVAATVDTLYVYGGTVSSIEQNGTVVGTAGPIALTLRPGDTWKLIYTVAPSVKRVVAA